MLPNNFRLFQETEDKLKKLKAKTGITPNISARIAFFKSIEDGYRYEPKEGDPKPEGTLALNNSVWFGEFEQLIETLIQDYYAPKNNQEILNIWANHVKYGETTSLTLIDGSN